MRSTRFLAIAMAIPMAAGLIAAGDSVETYGACANTDGKTVVSVGEGFNSVVDTPIGVPFAPIADGDAGTFVVSLEGLEVGSVTNTTFSLTWDNLEADGDYDIVLNGTNDLGTDYPEVRRDSSFHCESYTVGTSVFLGTPVDTLTLDVSTK